jgi:hypothetical protein
LQLTPKQKIIKPKKFKAIVNAFPNRYGRKEKAKKKNLGETLRPLRFEFLMDLGCLRLKSEF